MSESSLAGVLPYSGKPAVSIERKPSPPDTPRTQQPQQQQYDSASDNEFLLVSILVERLDANLFRSVMLWTPQQARGTFGGQLIAQSLEAARLTIPDASMFPHSIHSHFLEAGRSDQPMYYYVEALRDGRAFRTRRVTARQDGRTVYTATVSFHHAEEPGIIHGPTAPVAFPPLSSATSERQMLLNVLRSSDVPASFKENLRRKTARRSPIELRYCLATDVLRPVRTDEPQFTWMRAAYSGNDRHTHRALAGFVSDYSLAMAPLYRHGFPNVNTSMMVSLDHCIFFHGHFRVDEWFVYETQSQWADSNRALCDGRVLTADGRLVMSVRQEALVRMKKGYVSNLTKPKL